LAINKNPSNKRKSAFVNAAKGHLASQPFRQDTSIAVKQPSEPEIFYLGGCIDNGNIISILKGPSNSNSTNSQKQGAAGELENRRE